MAKLPEDTLSPFIYLFHHSTPIPYLYIWDAIHPPNTYQISVVVHLYSPDSKPLLPCHFLTTIHKSSHEQCLPLTTFLQLSASSVPDSSKTCLKFLNSDTCSIHVLSTRNSLQFLLSIQHHYLALISIEFQSSPKHLKKKFPPLTLVLPTCHLKPIHLHTIFTPFITASISTLKSQGDMLQPNFTPLLILKHSLTNLLF